MKHVTQEERLDYLVEEFKTDSGEYRNSNILLLHCGEDNGE